MNNTRITAHFNTQENAKKAHKRLLNTGGYFTNIKIINKKISIENDIESRGLKINQDSIFLC